MVRRSEPVEASWPELLNQALELPGRAGETYSRFRSLSLGNQALLMIQSEIVEPQHTYKGWTSLQRQVKKGSKAKAIFVPMFRKEVDAKGEEDRKLSGFKLVNCMFGVSDTEGEDLPEFEPATWSKDRALGALAIQEVPFNMMSGSVQGWSKDREYAISPVAAYPFKTTMHELSHIQLGHTATDQFEEYRAHRGLYEFQAEGSAYLALNELGATDQFDAAESRAYISGWLKGERPDDQAIKQVFAATDKIIKAGRQPEEVISE